jgi:hypothetical protein
MNRMTTAVAAALSLALLAGCASFPKDLTITPRLEQPPAGKALVNFHRPSKWGGAERFAIFSGDGAVLVDLPGAAQFQHVCDPGEHLFLAWADQASVVKAELEAGKVYDIMVDISMGWVRGNIKLIPLAKDDDRRARLGEFEKRERVVSQSRTAHLSEYEQKNKGRIEEIKQDFLSGEKSDRVSVLRKEDCR